MTASDFDRDRDVIFFADTREESIYAAFIANHRAQCPHRDYPGVT
jgi:hypothetical protein